MIRQRRIPMLALPPDCDDVLWDCDRIPHEQAPRMAAAGEAFESKAAAIEWRAKHAPGSRGFKLPKYAPPAVACRRFDWLRD